MNDQGVKRVKSVRGALLRHARAVENKLLVALGTTSAQEASATKKTMKQLINY